MNLIPFEWMDSRSLSFLVSMLRRRAALGNSTDQFYVSWQLRAEDLRCFVIRKTLESESKHQLEVVSAIMGSLSGGVLHAGK